MKIKSQKDFFAGLMFTGVGGSFAAGASQYTLGSGAKMGPGYFPFLLGIVMIVLGALYLFVETAAHDDEQEEDYGPPQWRGWLAIRVPVASY